MKKCTLFIAALSLSCMIQAQKVYSVDYDYQADVKVYVVNYDYQADLKIFFVDYNYQAGWRENSKQHFMW